MRQLLRLLLLLSLAAGLHSPSAQAQPVIDSLQTGKTAYRTDESIVFRVRLHPQAPSDAVRMIPTMSCACNDRDFYYRVVRVDRGLKGGKHPVYRDHTEALDAKRCLCKTQYAVFRNGVTWSVPPIEHRGRYRLEVQSRQSLLISNEFTVTD